MTDEVRPRPAEPSEVPPPPAEAPGGPRWVWWVIAAVAVVAVGAVLILASSRVTVPQAVGLAQESAEAAITGAGLDVGSVTEEETLGAEPGTVIKQAPGADEQVREGTGVNLTVAVLPVVNVPDLVGVSASEGEARLAEEGLQVGELGYANSETMEAGLVISQDPEAQAEATVGSYVSVTVSLGEQKDQVPNVVGLPLTDAESVLKEAGFEVRTVKAESGSVAAGDVISQSPAAGTAVSEGSAVTLTVSSGTPKPAEESVTPADPGDAASPDEPEVPERPQEPTSPTEPAQEMAVVPDVLGLRVLEAIGAIRDAQLKTGIEFGPSQEEFLRVAEQEPGAGVEAERGSVITITIGLPEFLFGETPPPAPVPEPLPSPGGEATSSPPSSSDTTPQE